MTNERISRNALASGLISMESTDAGLAAAGSQLISYHAAKRSGWLSARLVRVEVATFQLADLSAS